MSYANGADVTITDNTEVLIAPVQLIKEEYRFFIINKNIVTGCQYNINGNIWKMANFAWSVYFNDYCHIILFYDLGFVQ